MIVRVQIVDLQKVMIDILNADLGFHPVERHSLQRQHRQGSGGVLREGLIDSQRNRRAAASPAVDEMRVDQFLADVLGHGGDTLRSSPVIRSPPAHLAHLAAVMTKTLNELASSAMSWSSVAIWLLSGAVL